jgi:hypothetical protein
MVALGLIVLMTMVALTQVWGRLTKLEARIEQLELGGFSFRSGDEAISEPAAAPVEIPTQPVPQAVPGAGPIVAAAEASVEPVVPQLRNEGAGPQAEPDRGFSFDDIFGRRLPIWGGGITLAVAGMLIVKIFDRRGPRLATCAGHEWPDLRPWPDQRCRDRLARRGSCA